MVGLLLGMPPYVQSKQPLAFSILLVSGVVLPAPTAPEGRCERCESCGAPTDVGFWLDGATHLVGAKWEQCPQDPKNNKTGLQLTVHIEACLAELGNGHGLWVFNGCSLVSALTLRCHVGARLIFRHIHIFKVDGRTWSKVVSSYNVGRYQQFNGAAYIVEFRTATQLFLAPGPMTRVCCQTPMCYESIRIIVWTFFCNVKCATQRAFA